MGLSTFCVATPFGAVRGAVSPKGLALVALPGCDWDTPLARLVKLYGPPKEDERSLAAKELRAYVAGQLHTFDVDIDLELATPFARVVLPHLCRIPLGRVATYGAIARDAGRPRAARAVGGVVGSNPVPIVIPCHRVVASTGLGGFGGGLPMKRWLLALEGVDPDAPPR